MKKIVLLAFLLTGKLAHSQSIYIINNDSLTCLSEKELDIVIGAFIDRDMYRVSFDTLSVGYDAAVNANSELEAINTILVNDLEISKVVIQSTEQQNKDLEKP